MHGMGGIRTMCQPVGPGGKWWPFLGHEKLARRKLSV